jgi:succinate dehydrogenase/fumarate reductase flavoprotein subunit
MPAGGFEAAVKADAMVSSPPYENVPLGQSEESLLRHAEIQRNVGDLNKKIREGQDETKIVIEKKICYVCKQTLEDKREQEIMKEQETKINKIKKNLEDIRNEDIELCSKIPTLKDDISLAKEIKEHYLKIREEFRPHREKLQTLIIKLEARLKQKEYIYTEKDIIIKTVI